MAELARELKLDRSAVSRRVRNAKERGYLRDPEDNQLKPSRLVLGDELPDNLQILPKPEDVRADVKKCASGSARLDGAQGPHGRARNSHDAYKACNRAHVQQEVKDPPVGGEPAETYNPQDDTLEDTLEEEVRELFASDDASEEI